MKKKKWIIALVIAAVLLSVGAVAAHEIISPDVERWLFAAKKTKTGSPKTVVAIVDGEEISQESVDACIINEEIIRKNKGEKDPVDEKDILNDLIRKSVSFHEAVRLGLEADYETAKAEIEEGYRITMEKNDESAALMRKYLQEMEMTEAEYFEEAGKVRQRSMTRNNLYLRVTEGMEGTEEEKKTAYEKYVDDLVAKADIQILTK